jgi:hypothetical protein
MRSRLLSVSQIGSYLAKESLPLRLNRLSDRVIRKIILFARGKAEFKYKILFLRKIYFKSIPTFCIWYSFE